MKRSLFAALVACVLIGFNSCVYNEYTTEEPETSIITLDLRVNSYDWLFDQNGSCYFCRLNVPELTSYVYNYAAITCYREYNKGTRDAYQLPLPQTIHNIDEGSGDLYTTTIDYSFSVGFVEIVITNNDFLYNTPEGMDFRLNIVYQF